MECEFYITENVWMALALGREAIIPRGRSPAAFMKGQYKDDMSMSMLNTGINRLTENNELDHKGLIETTWGSIVGATKAIEEQCPNVSQILAPLNKAIGHHTPLDFSDAQWGMHVLINTTADISCCVWQHG
jgi:hypothetical protein